MALDLVLVVGGSVLFYCAHALTVAFGSLAGVALPLTSSCHVNVTRKTLNHVDMMGQGVVCVCVFWGNVTEVASLVV